MTGALLHSEWTNLYRTPMGAILRTALQLRVIQMRDGALVLWCFVFNRFGALVLCDQPLFALVLCVNLHCRPRPLRLIRRRVKLQMSFPNT